MDPAPSLQRIWQRPGYRHLGGHGGGIRRMLRDMKEFLELNVVDLTDRP